MVCNNRPGRYDLVIETAQTAPTTKDRDMTRKHFRMMARDIKAMESIADREIACKAFATVAQSVNSRFDLNMFRAACGLDNRA